MIDMHSHKETIKCPECGTIQEAEVLHTEPFSTYLHDCISCNYTITESEWECVDVDNVFGLGEAAEPDAK
jgi:predicted RNA-binding Zn-ribbon protein involved in translation (DUF1610 family)